MDIVLDTCILIDLVQQYTNFLGSTIDFSIQDSTDITKNVAKRLNELIVKKRNGYYVGYIVTSTFSFIELARKISDFNIQNDKLKAFIEQPPDWLIIEATTPALLEYLVLIPKRISNGDSVEWADAIVVATALSRQDFLLGTSDRTIRKIPILRGKLLI
jgi:predicted nucleic acid-binding protein